MDHLSNQDMSQVTDVRNELSSAGRLSLLDIRRGSTEPTEPLVSPGRSIYPKIENMDDIELGLNAERTLNTTETDIQSNAPTLSMTTRPEQLTVDTEDPYLAPKASDVHLRHSIPQRPRFNGRSSLLNEPTSFLSTSTSSTASSIQSSFSRENADTENEIISKHLELQPAANTVPAHHDSSNFGIQGKARLLDSRPKTARILTANLQALATEQGGIPISALSSPIYNQSSAATVIPLLHSSHFVDHSSNGLTLPGFDGIKLPQPLGAHVSTNDNLLHRSATLPLKPPPKKPKFLPAPLVMPASRGSFTRESVISTPYPGAGSVSPRRLMSLSNSVVDTRFKHPVSTLKIPLLVRSAKNYISKVGKISSPDIPLSRNTDGPRDDCELVKDIAREYRRVQGLRTVLSARCLTGIQIVFKFHAQDAYTTEAVQSSTWKDDYHLKQPPPTAEDYYTNAQVTSPCALSSTAKLMASKQHLEGTLNLLLERPYLGADSHVCSADLRTLILDTTRLDDNSGRKAAVALEVVQGWNRLKICIIASLIMILSVLSMVSWVLFGISQEATIVDKVFTSSIKMKLGGWTVDNANHGWNGAGARVESGATLGILVLLLGWSWMALWMGMSWLVD